MVQNFKYKANLSKKRVIVFLKMNGNSGKIIKAKKIKEVVNRVTGTSGQRTSNQNNHSENKNIVIGIVRLTIWNSNNLRMDFSLNVTPKTIFFTISNLKVTPIQGLDARS